MLAKAPVACMRFAPKSAILASGMRQHAGTRTKYRRAHAAPLTGVIFGRVEYGDAGQLKNSPLGVIQIS